MSDSSRDIKSTEEKKPKVTILHAGKITSQLNDVREFIPISDTLILIRKRQELLLMDLGKTKPSVRESKQGEKKSAPAEVTVTKLLEYQYKDNCCVSSNKQWLAVLSKNKISIMNIKKVTSAEDFKKLTVTSCQLSTPLLDKRRVTSLFFIGDDDTHVFATLWTGSTEFALIDVRNGNATLVPMQNVIDVCPFGKDKVLIAKGPLGLAAYSVNFNYQGNVLRSPVELIPPAGPDAPRGALDILDCAASPDCQFIVTKAMISNPPHNRNAVFRWKISPEMQLEAYGVFKSPPYEDEGGTPIFFNYENNLIYFDEAARMCSVASDSATPQVFDHAEFCCALPGGNILAMNEMGVFNVIVPDLRSIYRHAMIMLMQSLEVSGVVKIFSGDLTKIIGGYAVEIGMFANALKKRIADGQFEREQLRKVIGGLLHEKMIQDADKNIMRLFLSAMSNGKGVVECANTALQTSGASEGLEEFLKNLQSVFAPTAGKRQKISKKT